MSDQSVRPWWDPVVEMQFDDPRQAPPKYRHQNHVRTDLPTRGFWLVAYREAGKCGVFLGRGEDGARHWPQRETELEGLVAELPSQTRLGRRKHGLNWYTEIPRNRFAGDDDAEREWLKSTLNRYATVFRPRFS